MGRASQICTRGTGRRFRHFGGRHRISFRSIRSPVGPRRPGRHGEVGGVLVSVLYPFWAGRGSLRKDLGAVAYRSDRPSRGVVTSQHRLAPKEDARAGGCWRDWVAALRLWACSASLRERWDQGSPRHPFFIPLKKIPTTRFRAQLLSPVAPSCRPSARGRRGGPRRDDKRAPWTPRGRRAGRPSVQQARTTAMGCGAAQGTCAAGSPLARPWGRAFLARVGRARPPRIAPPRPADASRPASIAGGAAELALVCDEGQGTLPGSGKARCARCARRDRPGAPWGRATPLRQPSPPRRGFASGV